MKTQDMGGSMDGEPPAGQERSSPIAESPEQPRAGDRERVDTVDATRRQRIAEAAYYHAQRRGFAPGGELDDWYAAEAEEDARTRTDS